MISKVFDQNILILIFIQLFIFFYQYGIGGIKYIHIFETSVDSVVGFGNFIVYFSVACISIITPILLDNFTEIGAFSFFGVFSLLGLLYFIFFVKATNMCVYQYEKDGGKISYEIISLSEKDKKELYWPDKFKVNSSLSSHHVNHQSEKSIAAKE